MRDLTDTLLVTLAPEEHEAADLVGLLLRYGTDYVTLRRIAKLLWKADLLFRVLSKRKTHYRRSRLTSAFLDDYIPSVENLIGPLEGVNRAHILRRYEKETIDPYHLPARISADFQLDRVEAKLTEALTQHSVRALILCDRLDEGWLPDSASTAALGGLANAAASFIDKQSPVQVVVFLRDNMFRALSHMDGDFSRNIEGSTLRLNWTKESLFHLVAERLRIAFDIPRVENDTKAWNRFAQRDLQNREGFDQCLKSTLYRPRDILVLLNTAYRVAGQDKRDHIVPGDVEGSAHQISSDRYSDLLKEYDEVLPGLRLFIDAFRSGPPERTYANTLALLESALDGCDFSQRAASDFALFDSPTAIFDALYGVGFIGVKDLTSSGYRFCHDGALATGELQPLRRTIVHPCYWKALSLSAESSEGVDIVEINDEYAPDGAMSKDFRTRLLGTVVSDLSTVPTGASGQTAFENWVCRAVKLLFSGDLRNVQLKPNGAAIQRRDIVATNMASKGFWKRILDDYHSRQVVFEAKNFEAMGPDEFRQIASYLTGEYGKFGLLVTRTENEGLSTVERGWVKEVYETQQKVIMVLPAKVLARAVRKIRSPKKYRYADDMLNKRMDTWVRSYLSLVHQGRRR